MRRFKKTLFTIIFLLYFSTFINADGTLRKNFPFQGYNLHSFNSYGYSSGTNSDLSTIANSNPAVLFSKYKFSGAVSYTYRTKIENVIINGVSSEQSFYYLPQSAVFMFSYDKLNTAIAYNQRHNQKLDLGDIPLTTVEDMDGDSGRSFTPIFKQQISAFSFMTSYLLMNNEEKESFLKIGGKYGLNYLYLKEEIIRLEAKAEIHAHNFALGLHYKINPKIEVGVYYEHHTEFTGNLEDKNGDILLIDDDNDSPYEDFRYRPGSSEFNTIVRMPGKLVTSLKYNFSENLFLTSDLYYIFWNYVGDNLKDAVEISSCVTKQFSDKLRGSAGMYISDRKYKYGSEFFDGQYATYFTLGANYQFNFFTLQLALADSHLLSDEARKNTIGKIGIEFGF